MIRPLRVSFAIPALDRGGPDRVFYELLSGLDRERFEPSLIVQKDDGDYLHRLSGRVRIDVIGSNRAGAGYPVAALRRHLRAQAPDIVISTLRMTLTTTAALIGLRRPPVHIVRPANHLSANARELIAVAPIKHRISLLANLAMLRLSDAVICQSGSLRADLDRYVKLEHKAYTIGNPVDLKALAVQANASAQAPAGAPALLSVGRLMPQKGYDLLIRAMPAVLRQHPGAQLTIIGEGSERAHLERLIVEHALGSQVSLPGFIANPYPLMKRCSLFVSSSRYEGFPNVVLEALALGRPVVATDCAGGTSEMIKPGLTGQLAACESPAALAAAILTGLRPEMQPRAADLVEFCRRNYSAPEITSAYEAAVLDTWRRCRRPADTGRSSAQRT